MPKKRHLPENISEADDDIVALVRAFARLCPAERIAHGRTASLLAIIRRRRMMARAPFELEGVVYDVTFFRDRIREFQIRLLKLRAWRETGVEPGNG
jgi:hypothetical protein